MPLAKAVRDAGRFLRRVVNHHWQQERLVVGHVQHAVDRQIPFAAEVALAAGVGVGRDDRDEQCTFLDLLAYRCVPRITPAQLALVEPYVEARGAECLADAARGSGVLRRVAEEDGFGGSAHSRSVRIPSALPAPAGATICRRVRLMPCPSAR